jgi:Protein of unknown function (DUF2630)
VAFLGFLDLFLASGLRLFRPAYFLCPFDFTAHPTTAVARELWQKELNMTKGKEDRSVLGHIDQLVKEEERLYGQSELAAEDRRRLAELKVELDQCWDLLRQRRALREFGEDPDKAKVRSAKIVENYEQ